MADRDLRDEVAELKNAVRELHDREVADELRSLRAEVEKLRAERAAHTCHGSCCSHVHCNHGHCGCFTWHGYGSTTVTYPQTFTVSAGGGNVSGSGWVSAGSGYNPSITTLGTGN